MRNLKVHPNCKRLKKKRNNEPTDELSAKRAWRRFNKKDTRRACYKLQLGLCAYTELSLDSAELGSHLEHIAPRSRFPERTFRADNLVLSILADDYSGTLKQEERFAGHFKRSRYADEWFISPYDEDCEKYFEYSSQTGEVNPANSLSNAERDKAMKTIAVLNLNCDYLVSERLKQLSALETKIRAIIATANLHTDSISKQLGSDLYNKKLESLAKETLQLTDNKLPEFYTAKQQLLKRYKQL